MRSANIPQQASHSGRSSTWSAGCGGFATGGGCLCPGPSPGLRRPAALSSLPTAGTQGAPNCWPGAQTLQAGGRKGWGCRATGGAGGASWELDPEEESALIEAGETLAEAERMAAEQTFREMMRSAVDGSSSSSGSVGGAVAAGAQGKTEPDERDPSTVVLGFGSDAYYPEAVKALQRLLGSAGFQPGGEYGRFGRKTEAALQGFQAGRGLEASGILEGRTLDAITAKVRDRSYTKAEVESMEFLRMFWHSEGLCRDDRSRDLLTRLQESLASSTDPKEMDLYFVRLQRLRRLLPKVDVLRMALHEPQVLTTDISVSTSNLVLLVQALPGQDIERAVAAFPRLLWQDGLMPRVKTCIDCYARWSPASDAMQILAENPSLIVRIPDYYSQVELGDLPIDIQNSMMIGGGGGGLAFRSWSGFTDNHTD